MRTPFIAMLVLLTSMTVLAQVPVYRVIVHPSNGVATMTRDQLTDMFLKKVTRWPSGETVRPVDLHSRSPARQKFAQDVLRRSLAAVRSYWQQLIFSGRNIPPPELDSDAAVIAYVLKYPGAIGYVSGEASCEAVKVVSIK